MDKDFPSGWMWSQAFDMLERAERMHREIFRPAGSSHRPAWEPPADILETPDEGLVLVALPGVDPEQVRAVIARHGVGVGGTRVLPHECGTRRVPSLEGPQLAC